MIRGGIFNGEEHSAYRQMLFYFLGRNDSLNNIFETRCMLLLISLCILESTLSIPPSYFLLFLLEISFAKNQIPL